ncbi:MAG: hypothetical protein AB7P76_00570 [Candidatus Melainabacteria bacterium]
MAMRDTPLETIQQQLAHRLLRAGLVSRPENKALATYNRLMNATVRDCLEGIYPRTTQRVLRWLDTTGSQPARAWKALAEEYRRNFPNPSYRLVEAVAHFPEFLARQDKLVTAHPHLVDLAQLEWADCVVRHAPNPLRPEASAEGDIPAPAGWTEASPVWNTACALLALDYPVAGEETPVAQSTLYCVYRDPDTLATRTLTVNPLTMAVLQQGMVNPTPTYAALLNQLIETQPALTTLPRQSVTDQLLGLFTTLRDQRILLGSSPPHS